MDISTIITIIGAAVSSIALPLFGVFLFYDSKKRKQSAEAKKAEADVLTSYAEEWKELYEKKESRVTELDAKIDSLYAEISKHRERENELIEENHTLKMELALKRCERKGCTQRQPQNGY